MITKYEKILHWLVLLVFLGLCSTALAAEYFFSKEAILDSFKKSLPMLNLVIDPADQFFMSRIARRDTWDIHLYFGIAFALFLTIWLTINLVKRNKRYLGFKIVFFTSAFTLAISGIWMFLRLYYEVSEEAFGLLKKVHYYAYWTFIYTLIIHIVTVIYIENKKKKGVLSEMINFKSIGTIALLATTLFGQNIYAATEQKSDLVKWANDKNYIEGVLYIEGEKGAEVLIKEISNCPYDKCKLEDVDQTQYGTKNIEIKKPDYKKAIEQLRISSNNGNALASEKLIGFLIKRIDYKSLKPSGYLLKQLKEETGLNFEDYKVIINKTLQDGVKTNKSCLSEYIAAELMEKGLMNNSKDLLLSKEYYKKATEICPNKNLYKLLAQGRLDRL
jgi:cytochrome b561